MRLSIYETVDLINGGRIDLALERQAKRAAQIADIGAKPIIDPVMLGYEVAEVAEAENITYITDDVLETSSLNIISGRSLSGKTYLLTNWIANIIEGGNFLGKRCHQTPVLWLNCDLNRIKRLHRNVLKNMDGDDKHDTFGKWFSMVKNDCVPATLTAKHLDAYVANLKRLTGRDCPILVVVDTFRSAFLSEAEKGTENDAYVMTLIRPIKEWVVRTGNAVMIVHHNNKHADDFAGSGAFMMLIDTKLNYQRPEDQAIGKLIVTTRDDFYDTFNIGLNRENRRPMLTGEIKTENEILLLDRIAETFGKGKTAKEAHAVYKFSQVSYRTFERYRTDALNAGYIVACGERTETGAKKPSIIYCEKGLDD